MKLKPKKKSVWGLIDSEGEVSIQFNAVHNVFQPRIYSTKQSAQKVSEKIVTGAEPLKVVPCTITYTHPTSKQKRV